MLFLGKKEFLVWLLWMKEMTIGPNDSLWTKAELPSWSMSKLAQIFPTIFLCIIFQNDYFFQGGVFGSQNRTHPIDLAFSAKREADAVLVILFSCWIKPTKTLGGQCFLRRENGSLDHNTNRRELFHVLCL